MTDPNDRGSGRLRCPVCSNTKLVPGDGVVGNFYPAKLRFFSLARSMIPLATGRTLMACLDCGHTWSRINPVELQKLIGDDVSPALLRRLAGPRMDLQCPVCLNSKLMPSSAPGAEEGSDEFCPLGLRFLSFRTSIPLTGGKRMACFKCGHMWGKVDPVKLQKLIDKSAGPELLRLLGEQEPDD